jgi:membrane protein implicated in regulation of membrane protease activity
MRRRGQLALMTGPPLFWAFFGLGGVAFDSADASAYLALILVAVVVLLVAVVSLLHRLLYGEDSNGRNNSGGQANG